MLHVAMVEYKDASPEVQEIYDEIRGTRGLVGLSDFWKTLAFHPPTLRRNWNQARDAVYRGQHCHELRLLY